MDRVLDQLPTIATIIVAYITFVYGPKVTAKFQRKSKKEEVKMEGDSKAEELYVKEMPLIIKEYKDQVSGFRAELMQVKKEFSEFRKQHQIEVEALKKQIKRLEDSHEEKDIQIKDLKALVLVKEEIIKQLEEEIKKNTLLKGVNK